MRAGSDLSTCRGRGAAAAAAAVVVVAAVEAIAAAASGGGGARARTGREPAARKARSRRLLTLRRTSRYHYPSILSLTLVLLRRTSRREAYTPSLTPYFTPNPNPYPTPYQARKNKSTVRMRSSIQPVRHADSPRGGGGGGALTPRRDASGGDGGEPAPLMSQGGDDGRGAGRGSEGDVAPLAVDSSVGWDKVGGLRGHIQLQVAGSTTHGCRLNHI